MRDSYIEETLLSDLYEPMIGYGESLKMNKNTLVRLLAIALLTVFYFYPIKSSNAQNQNAFQNDSSLSVESLYVQEEETCSDVSERSKKIHQRIVRHFRLIDNISLLSQYLDAQPRGNCLGLYIYRHRVLNRIRNGL